MTRAIPWLMIGAYVAAVVLLLVFATEVDWIAAHGWRLSPRG